MSNEVSVDVFFRNIEFILGCMLSHKSISKVSHIRYYVWLMIIFFCFKIVLVIKFLRSLVLAQHSSSLKLGLNVWCLSKVLGKVLTKTRLVLQEIVDLGVNNFFTLLPLDNFELAKVL